MGEVENNALKLARLEGYHDAVEAITAGLGSVLLKDPDWLKPVVVARGVLKDLNAASEEEIIGALNGLTEFIKENS